MRCVLILSTWRLLASRRPLWPRRRRAGEERVQELRHAGPYRVSSLRCLCIQVMVHNTRLKHQPMHTFTEDLWPSKASGSQTQIRLSRIEPDSKFISQAYKKSQEPNDVVMKSIVLETKTSNLQFDWFILLLSDPKTVSAKQKLFNSYCCNTL